MPSRGEVPKPEITIGNPSEVPDQDATEKTGLTGSSNGSSSGMSRGSLGKKRRKSQAKTKSRSRYKTTGQLGRGGWGVVESAVDRQLQRPVAIKRMSASIETSQEVVDRFLHEARVTSQLQHPGIVPVHELEDGQSSNDLYYVMKLLDGQSFRQSIRDTHSQLITKSADSAWKLRDAILPLLERFIDVCDAVSYAHDQGVIHRDLKPDNVMIGGFGETIVVDWGLAKRLWASNDLDDEATCNLHLSQAEEALASISSPSATAAGSVIGTPAYMPPEQANGQIEELSPASDIYSLGAMLYEIVVGNHPHSGLDVKQVLKRVRNGTRKTAQQARSTVSVALSAICEKAMAFQVADRYSSAAELAEDVRRYISGESVSVVRENIWERTARWCRRHRTLAFSIAISTVILLAISTMAGLLIHRSHVAEQQAHDRTLAAYEESLDRMEQSRRAADSWLIDLSGSLQFFPGLEPVRKDLIGQAIEHYQDLLISHDFAVGLNGINSPNLASHSMATSKIDQRLPARLMIEQTMLHLRLGDLRRLQNEHEQALSYYQLAETTAAQALDGWKMPEAYRQKMELQLAQAMIGKLLLDEVVNVGVSKDWLDRHLQDAARRFNAEDSQFKMDLASARARLGLAIARSSGAPESDVVSESSIAVDWAKWLFHNRGSSSDLRLLETASMEYANRLEDSGQHKLAADVWSELVNEMMNFDDHGQRMDRMQTLAYARLKWANSLVRLTDVDSEKAVLAKQQYEQAIKDFQIAWRLSDSDGFFQRNLASVENNLGTLLANSGSEHDRLAAKDHLENSIQIRKSLIRQQPSTAEIRLFCQSIASYAAMGIESTSEHRISVMSEADIGYQLIQHHGQLSTEDRKNWASLLNQRADLNEALGNRDAAITDRVLSKRILNQD